MTLVVDASVAVKWVLLEPDSPAARDLVGAGSFVAPDVLPLACANGLAHQVRRRKLTAAPTTAGLARMRAAGVKRESPDRHAGAAQRPALALGATVDDSRYLAVALAQPCRLITADTRFADLTDAAHPGVVRRL